MWSPDCCEPALALAECHRPTAENQRDRRFMEGAAESQALGLALWKKHAANRIDLGIASDLACTNVQPEGSFARSLWRANSGNAVWEVGDVYRGVEFFAVRVGNASGRARSACASGRWRWGQFVG